MKAKKGRSKAARKDALARRRRRLAPPDKAPDPSQNLHVEKGRPITLDEVRASALPGCRTCGGSGKTPRKVLCPCAQRRFMKKHPEIILDRMGFSWWPVVGAEPSMAADPEKHSEDLSSLSDGDAVR